MTETRMGRPFDPGRVEDLLWLIACGVPVSEALARVGWTAAAAYRWALRHHHHELKAAVRAAQAAGRPSRAKHSRRAAALSSLTEPVRGGQVVDAYDKVRSS